MNIKGNYPYDRYVTFCDIECDENADKLVAMLVEHLQAGHGGGLWCEYFSKKRREQQRMQRDNLNLVGNQINPLYEYFEACDDQTATELLYRLEQECC